MKAQEKTFDEDKLLPNDINLEKNIIGIILSEPGLFHEANRILTSEAFYLEAHKIIWDAIKSVSENNNPDCAALVQHFRKTNQLDNIGGAVYLITIANNSPAHAYIERDAFYLKEIYLRRKLIILQTKSIDSLYGNQKDVFDELAEAQLQIEKLINEIHAIRETYFSDVIVERVAELKDAANKHNYRTGVCSHLNSLDKLTNGFQPSDLIILAARPSMGKSALAIDCARKQAKNGTSVGIFSLEMSTQQIVDRLLAAENEIDLSTVRRGGMVRYEWERIDENVKLMLNYPMVVNDKGALPITDLCAMAKVWKMKYKIEILYVDYLQLITDSGFNRGRSREQEVSYISSRLKALAKDLNIPVVVLSQLSRAVETRGGDKRPMLSDLRDSGSIEQDADLVIFPFRPGYYDDTQNQTLCELIVAKYRNGQTGFINSKFIGAFQKFDDYVEPF